MIKESHPSGKSFSHLNCPTIISIVGHIHTNIYSWSERELLSETMFSTFSLASLLDVIFSIVVPVLKLFNSDITIESIKGMNLRASPEPFFSGQAPRY